MGEGVHDSMLCVYFKGFVQMLLCLHRLFLKGWKKKLLLELALGARPVLGV